MPMFYLYYIKQLNNCIKNSKNGRHLQRNDVSEGFIKC